MRLFPILIAVLLAVGAVLAWQYLGRPPVVETAVLTRGSAAEVIYATGFVEPDRWAKVTPVRRGRIIESCECEGKEVGKGDLLFRLDDAESRAQVAELAARLSLAQKELVRTADLFSRGVTTRERYDQVQSTVTEARAALEAAESRQLELEIRAPMDGQVLRLEGEVGEVSELGAPLAWVGQPAPLLIVAEVNEEDIPRVIVGQEALLKADAFPGEALPATVASITPMGDPELQTYRVRLSLPADTPLLIGMSVDVNIVVRIVEDAVLAPAPALAGDTLQVVGEDGVVELRKVRVGIRGASHAEIVGGADAGLTVISPAVDDIAPGARVRIEAGG